MALDFQTVPVVFNQGLDTKTQRKLVPAGKWDTLENYSLSDDDSLKVRDGIEQLATGTCNSLAPYNNELVGVTESLAFAVDQTNDTTHLREGRAPNVFIDKRQVYMGQGTVESCDCAHGDGYTAYVWLERGPVPGAGAQAGIFCSVVEEASGAVVLNRGAIANVATTLSSPRVVYLDGAFYFFFYSAAGQTISGNAIETSAPSVLGSNQTIASIVNTATSTRGFDACVFNGEVLVGYMHATPSVRAVTVTRSGTTVSVSVGPTNVISNAEVTDTTIGGVACAAFSATRAGIFLSHTAGGSAGAGIVGVVFDDTLTVTTAATQLDSATPPVTGPTHIVALGLPGGGVDVYADQISSQDTPDFRPVRGMRVTSTLAVALGPSTVLNSACFRSNAAEAAGPQGPFIAGKPFLSGAHTYLPMMVLESYGSLNSNTANDNAQCSFFLFRASLGLSVFPVAGALYGSVGVRRVGFNGFAVTPACSTPAVGDGFRIALPEVVDLQLRKSLNVSPIGVASLSMTVNSTESIASDQLQQSLFLGGGQLASYDGVRVAEHGFSLFPEGISVVVSLGATPVLTQGTHQLVAVYDWTDGAGQRHQSTPSPAVSFDIVNANDLITVVVPALLVSNKTDVTISLYMTTAGGLTFYRYVPTQAAMSNTTAASTVSSATVLINTDDWLESSEQLYTQPNLPNTSLANLAPGPSSAFKEVHNRIWFKKDDQPYRYGYSLEPVAATGLRFNPGLGGLVPTDSGGIVGFEQLDEKSIIFCRRQPYVIYGTGPTASGAFNNYSSPQPIMSDVGCSTWRSILQLPTGIIFKSPKGWYILGRDLSVRYIGDGVSRWDSYEVASAVLVGDKQECRFGLVGGPTLVYSYLSDQWSTFRYAADSYQPVTACWWPGAADGTGRYVSANNSNGIMQDVPDSQTDDIGSGPAVIRTLARTPWLHLSKLEGFQRLRRLYFTATGGSPDSTILLSVFFDDDYNGSAPGAYSVAIQLGSISFSPTTVIDLRHRLARQKCKSVAFSFSETNDDPEGSRTTGMQALLLEVGVKRGSNKLPATQTVG